MIVDTHVHIWERCPKKYPIGPHPPPTGPSEPDEPATRGRANQGHGPKTVLTAASWWQTSWSTWDNGYIADSQARFPRPALSATACSTRKTRTTPSRHATGWRKRGLVRFSASTPLYYPDEKVLTTPQNRPMWEVLAAMGAVIQFHLNAACADQIAEIAPPPSADAPAVGPHGLSQPRRTARGFSAHHRAS